MISTKKELKFWIKEDAKRNGCDVPFFKYWAMLFLRQENALAFRYIKTLRKCEYESSQDGLLHRIITIYLKLKLIRLGSKYHIRIPLNKTGYGLRIMHLSGGGGGYFIECQ